MLKGVTLYAEASCIYLSLFLLSLSFSLSSRLSVSLIAIVWKIVLFSCTAPLSPSSHEKQPTVVTSLTLHAIVIINLAEEPRILGGENASSCRILTKGKRDSRRDSSTRVSTADAKVEEKEDGNGITPGL